MSDYKVTRRKLRDYQPNPNNANLGSERGSGMIERSYREYGAGRSWLASSDGILLAGNQSQQGALNAGIEDVLEVETDGNVQVVVKRRDLKADDKKAIELGLVDNRSAEISLTWDVDRLLADVERGVDLSGLWRQDELDELLKETVTYGDNESGLTPDERLDIFMNATIKQIVLYFTNDEFEDVIARMQAVSKAHSLDNNTEVVLKLLEHYEATTG